jgi:guanylate kinase
MGRIFTLSGPSGVGKTTFLQSLFLQRRSDLALLPRYTDRPRRNEEDEGFEHYFISHAGLLQKVFANDFIHIEKWGDYYSAVESHTIEEALKADHDGIVLTSVFGAARLRATYGYSVSCLYLWTGRRPSLLDPRCLENESPEVQELKWRIRKKKAEDHFSEFETASLTDDAFLNKRMVDNFLDVAAVNGRLRAGEDIVVLENPHDKVHLAIEAFQKFRESVKTIKIPAFKQRGGGCFVLMPFTDEMRPVYDDHLVKVCSELGISVTRSDQIFSTRPIMDDIREAVISARYVIADLTNDNPNVFYELGVCHAMGKNVILVTQKTDVPFDVRHIRHIRYEYTPRGMQAFEATLTETLRTLQFSA